MKHALAYPPLPTTPGTVIDVVVLSDDRTKIEHERYIRVPDEGTVDGQVWLSLEDHERWDVTPVNGWRLVALPVAEFWALVEVVAA